MPEETPYQQGEKFVRFVHVLDELLRTQQGKTVRELAEAVGVSTRGVQRYIGQMRAAGLDIDEDDQHRYRVGEGTRLPPLQFTQPEAVAVLMALRLLQQMRTSQDAALAGAVGRLAAALHVDTVTAYLGAMLRAIERDPEDGVREQIERVVTQCFVNRIPCEIEYENAAGDVSKRAVRVYFLEPRPESRTVYVYGFDQRSSSLRWFRMDRIRTARELRIAGTYALPQDLEMSEVTRSSWGIWQADDELQEIVLRFRQEATARVRLSQWHGSARLTDLEGGGVELRMRVASEIELRPWVLGWGSLVEVLEPASLRDHVAASMREGAAIYDR